MIQNKKYYGLKDFRLIMSIDTYADDLFHGVLDLSLSGACRQANKPPTDSPRGFSFAFGKIA